MSKEKAEIRKAKESNRDDMEVRFIGSELRIERNDEGGPVFTGMAIVYDSWSQDLGGFREIIKPGASAKALRSTDTRALINHNSDMVLGRKSAGTLKLKESRDGVSFEISAPNTTIANDLALSVERGDIDGCSFAFSIAKGGEEWKEINDDSLMERTITEFKKIPDVSIVSFPAYTDTTVALRNLEEYRKSLDSSCKNSESQDNTSNDGCSCANCRDGETDPTDKTDNPNPGSNESANQPDSKWKVGLRRKKLDLKLKTKK